MEVALNREKVKEDFGLEESDLPPQAVGNGDEVDPLSREELESRLEENPDKYNPPEVNRDEATPRQWRLLRIYNVMAEYLGRPPSTRDMEKYSPIDPPMYYNHFDKPDEDTNVWSAVVRFAGHDPDQIRKGRPARDATVVKNTLQFLERIIPDGLTSSQVGEYAEFGTSTALRKPPEYSWKAVREWANLDDVPDEAEEATAN